MMSTKISGKDALLKRLTSILHVGDEDSDYVTDVLDQLIEIGDDVDDVASYLTSFLGGDDDADGDLMQFASDVKRFKLGEEIAVEAVGSSAESNVAETRPQTGKEATQQQQQPLHQKPSAKSQDVTVPTKQNKVVQSSHIITKEEKPAKGNVMKNNDEALKQTKANSSSANSKSNTKRHHKANQPKKIQKGVAKIICGCYGTKHNPLTNCLYCGRISCEAEGYDFCPFCGILIEDFSQRIHHGDRSSSSSALLHKERLLEFDRTSAARTHILDDQEDYFASSNSMWSTQAEQDNAKTKEEERRKMLHERQKQKLTINF